MAGLFCFFFFFIFQPTSIPLLKFLNLATTLMVKIKLNSPTIMSLNCRIDKSILCHFHLLFFSPSPRPINHWLLVRCVGAMTNSGCSPWASCKWLWSADGASCLPSEFILDVLGQTQHNPCSQADLLRSLGKRLYLCGSQKFVQYPQRNQELGS